MSGGGVFGGALHEQEGNARGSPHLLAQVLQDSWVNPAADERLIENRTQVADVLELGTLVHIPRFGVLILAWGLSMTMTLSKNMRMEPATKKATEHRNGLDLGGAPEAKHNKPSTSFDEVKKNIQPSKPSLPDLRS